MAVIVKEKCINKTAGQYQNDYRRKHGNQEEAGNIRLLPKEEIQHKAAEKKEKGMNGFAAKAFKAGNVGSLINTAYPAGSQPAYIEEDPQIGIVQFIYAGNMIIVPEPVYNKSEVKRKDIAKDISDS